MKTEIEDNRLYELLKLPIPPLSKIADLLRVIEPVQVHELLENDPESIHTMDYYFRLFSPEIGGRILSHPDFSMKMILELIKYQAKLHTDENGKFTGYSEDTSLDSYWNYLTAEKMRDLFSFMLRAESNYIILAFVLFNKLKNKNLFAVGNRQVQVLLDYFIESGENYENFIINNPALYDHMRKLAGKMDDNKYILYLESFAPFAARLSMAETFTEEAENHLDCNGFLPLRELVEIINSVPKECIEMTLELLVQKKRISRLTMKGILRLKVDR